MNDEPEKDKYFQIIKFPKNKTLQEILDSTSTNKTENDHFWGKLFPSETLSHSESKERLINSFHSLFPSDNTEDPSSPEAKQKRLEELKKMSEVFQIINTISSKSTKPKQQEQYHKHIQKYNLRKHSSSSTFTKRKTQKQNKLMLANDKASPLYNVCNVDNSISNCNINEMDDVQTGDINVNEDNVNCSLNNNNNNNNNLNCLFQQLCCPSVNSFNINNFLFDYNQMELQLLLEQMKQRCGGLLTNTTTTNTANANTASNIDLNTIQELYRASLINNLNNNYYYNYYYNNALQMQLQLYSNMLYFQFLWKYQTYNNKNNNNNTNNSNTNTNVNTNLSLHDCLSLLNQFPPFNNNNNNNNVDS